MKLLTDEGLKTYDEKIKTHIQEQLVSLENELSNEIFSDIEPTSQNDGDVWTKLIN